MVDVRLQSDGNVRLRWYPSNGFSNPYWPTVAELNAGLRLEDAVPWENFEFGMQASDTSDTPPISAKASVGVRSTANYGGSLSVWYPGYYDDPTNQLSLIYDAINADERTIGYIALSVDGEIGEPDQPDSDFTFANGDYVSIYRVQADAWTDMTEGDDPFYYTRNFLRNGQFAHYTVASTSAPVLAITVPTTADVGDVVVASATVNGREYSKGVAWSTTTPLLATVSPGGVITYLDDGSANVTATLRRTTSPTTDTETVTVSA